jgi:hypothetical protein
MGSSHAGHGISAKVLSAGSLSGVLHRVQEITSCGSLRFIFNGNTAPTSRISLKELLWSGGVLKISERRLRISHFEYSTFLIFQSAIRNLKSAINFAPLLHGRNKN